MTQHPKQSKDRKPVFSVRKPLCFTCGEMKDFVWMDLGGLSSGQNISQKPAPGTNTARSYTLAILICMAE